MIGMICDKCGAKAEIRDEEANRIALSAGWACMVSAVDKNSKMDLCPACNVEWDGIRRDLIQAWMEGRVRPI